MPNESHVKFEEQLKQTHVLIGPPSLLQRLQNQSACPNLRWFLSLNSNADRLVQIAPHYKNTPPPFVTSRAVQFYGPQIAEYVIGATGMIGQDVAKRLHVMGVKLWGLYRRKRLEGEPLFTPQFEPKDVKQLLPQAAECYERMFYMDDPKKSRQSILKEFLSGVDVLLNALPSTPESDYLLGGGETDDKNQCHPLQYCKPNCIFINVGRASIISQSEIILALKNNWVQTIVLDVFEQEPLTSTNALLTSNFPVNRLILTPHISGCLKIDPIFEQLLAENLQLYAKGMVVEKTTGKPWIPNLYYMMNWKQGY
ncbi:MAG: hypothetical protein EZS28_005848 [Streblomastix strix]|uniref:D-isomer specific 2-hydroxyacid dehydrogenase NAD-binding domain-containing protein n=1 Tax=Streblomastix strix TaxID=222440 RepID=A0A5J4WUH8_9EUKA|nr:MAG: hypothetical protein EZS28_005848 [Streblomastix strix]